MGIETECEYYNWDKLVDSEDFWDLIERIDEINTRNRAVEAQKTIFKAEKYKELAYRVGLERMHEILMDEVEIVKKPINLGKVKKKILFKRAIALSESGYSAREISQHVNVHYSTVCRWIKDNRSDNNASNRTNEDQLQRRNMVEEAGC